MDVRMQFVKRMQRKHNTTEAFKAIGFSVLALILWPMCYWIVKTFVIVLYFLWGSSPRTRRAAEPEHWTE